MSILSGIGQQPPIFGTGGQVEYYNGVGSTTNLTSTITAVNVYNTIPLPQGVYLVSFGVTINNLDTAPVDFAYYRNVMRNIVTILTAQEVQSFTLASAQVYSTIFTAVAYWDNAVANIALNNAINISITSGAFATTAPTISTNNISIVKIA